MSLHRRAAKRDDSEPGIMGVFLSGGAKVKQLSSRGVSDLLVGYRGVNHLVECKTGNGKLTPDQQQFYDEWLGEKPEVARNEAQAKKLLRKWDEDAKHARTIFPDPVQDQADGVREEE